MSHVSWCKGLSGEEYLKHYKNGSRANKNKGKTFEQIYGKKKANKIKSKISLKTVGRIPWDKGLSAEEYKKHYKNFDFLTNKKGKTYEQLYGKKKALEIRKKESKKAKYNMKHGVLNAFSKGEKHSKYWLGKQIPQYVKDKISKTLTGSRVTKATRKKLSISLKKANENIILRKRKSATAQGIPLEQWTYFRKTEKYDSNFNKKFKDMIKKRDNYKCIVCGGNYRLTVHHVDYNKQNTTLENCVLICGSCHSKTVSNRKYWIEFLHNLIKLKEEDKNGRNSKR